MDLLSYFNATLIPKMEALCQRVETTTGKRSIVRFQMDGAGPHRDTTFVQWLENEYFLRSWTLKFQPSNSPVTNVKDDCIFPALSKHVSREQGLNNGSRIFSPDELWRAVVEKCWNEFPPDKAANAYIRHAQIATALIQCNGGDKFVRNSNLHFNIRQCFVPVCDDNGRPTGVEAVASIVDPESEEDDNGGGNNNDRRLRCQQPNFDD